MTYTTRIVMLWRQTRRASLMRKSDTCHYCNIKLIAWLGIGAPPIHTLAINGEPVCYATLDHVIALACGGQDTNENTVLACAKCNVEKKDMSYGAFVARKRVKS